MAYQQYQPYVSSDKPRYQFDMPVNNSVAQIQVMTVPCQEAAMRGHLRTYAASAAPAQLPSVPR
jgi:hypothetical protein